MDATSGKVEAERAELRRVRLVEALAWEACNIANEGRLIAGQLERIRHLRDELKRWGK